MFAAQTTTVATATTVKTAQTHTDRIRGCRICCLVFMTILLKVTS
jgi:hypothetical protein